MTTLDQPRSFLDVVAAQREANRQAVLAAAHRLGSTLRGTFDAYDLQAATRFRAQGLFKIVHRLKALGLWPYEEPEPGVWRDPRPWFERIAREVEGFWQDV